MTVTERTSDVEKKIVEVLDNKTAMRKLKAARALVGLSIISAAGGFMTYVAGQVGDIGGVLDAGLIGIAASIPLFAAGAWMGISSLNPHKNGSAFETGGKDRIKKKIGK
jgi:hypothetical protein